MYYYKDLNKNLWALLTESQDESLTAITEEEFNELCENLKLTTDESEQIKLENEMLEIKQWLNEHDYIINKHLLGEYTDNDERWINYLQERAVKLARYNELEQEF